MNKVMENLEPGGRSPIEHVEIAMNQTIGFFTQMIAKGLQGIEQMSGAGKTITDLPEGIVDVGAYFLLQEPGKEGYSLQVNKKHLLRGMNDSKSGTEAIRYMSSTDKQNITKKIVRLKLLHDILCENRVNIGFSKTMKQDYYILNRLNNSKVTTRPSKHSVFMRELLYLIHSIYQKNLENLYDDMAIIRKSIIHQGGVNSDPYEYYKEWSRDPKHVAERAQTDELRQHIKGKKALLILMEEIERYPFKSIRGKREMT